MIKPALLTHLSHHRVYGVPIVEGKMERKVKGVRGHRASHVESSEARMLGQADVRVSLHGRLPRDDDEQGLGSGAIDECAKAL